MSLKRGCWVDHHSMVIDMNDTKLVTLEQLRGFLAGAADLGLTAVADPAARYGLIKGALKRFKYPLPGKADRGRPTLPATSYRVLAPATHAPDCTVPAQCAPGTPLPGQHQLLHPQVHPQDIVLLPPTEN